MAQIKKAIRRDTAYVLIQVAWLVSLVVVLVVNPPHAAFIIMFIALMVRIDSMENKIDSMGDEQ